MKTKHGHDASDASDGSPALDSAREKDTAERILDAASELLAASGYAALSMRKVGACVGLSQAAIYRHYADKAELVGKVVERGYGLLRASLEKIGAEVKNPVELLAAGMHAYVTFAGEHPRLFKAILLQDIGPSQDRVNALSPGVARQRKTFEMLAGLVAKGVAEGLFSPCDPEITAQAVWAAMFGLAARMALEQGGRNGAGRRHAIVERQVEIIIRGLRGNKEKS